MVFQYTVENGAGPGAWFYGLWHVYQSPGVIYIYDHDTYMLYGLYWTGREQNEVRPLPPKRWPQRVRNNILTLTCPD